MANHLKVFENETAYSAFTGSSAYVTPNVSVCSGGGGSIFYNPKDYSLDYFTTVAKTSGTVSFSGSVSGTVTNKLSYSKDNGITWSDPSQTPEVTVNSGDKVLWKGECIPNSTNGIGKFTNGTATFDVEGNAMSLLFGDDFKGQTSLEGKGYAFYRLFSGNTNVNSAENLSLPATTLADKCYSNMFYYCTSLESAPVLPATTLAHSCYSSMFAGCIKLATAPELPAMTLADWCYQGMFYGCTGLTTATALPATTTANFCYESMFTGCISLTTAPSILPAMTLADWCYQNMFSGCTSLTTATELPATTLFKSCYQNMFYGCSSLTTAPALPATTLAEYCYTSMFYGCSSLTTAPALPATTLFKSCYQGMFNGCTSLNSITCLATNISASNCTYLWVYGVSSSGTFTKAASMTSWTTSANGIPLRWSVVDDSVK